MPENDSINQTVNFSQERYDLKILQSLRRIMRSIDINSSKLKTQYDITTPQLITILAIADNGPITIAAISKKVYIGQSTLVGIIDRLESKKLVLRQRSSKDRRQIHISITDLGKEFVEKTPSPLQEKLANALSKLTDNEQSNIANSLEKIIDLMEAEEFIAAPILEAGALDSKV